jgi:hypothetical protein
MLLANRCLLLRGVRLLRNNLSLIGLLRRGRVLLHRNMPCIALRAILRGVTLLRRGGVRLCLLRRLRVALRLLCRQLVNHLRLQNPHGGKRAPLGKSIAHSVQELGVYLPKIPQDITRASAVHLHLRVGVFSGSRQAKYNFQINILSRYPTWGCPRAARRLQMGSI